MQYHKMIEPVWRRAAEEMSEAENIVIRAIRFHGPMSFSVTSSRSGASVARSCVG